MYHCQDAGFNEYVKKQLLFHRVVSVEAFDEQNAELTLDNGTILEVRGNEGYYGVGYYLQIKVLYLSVLMIYIHFITLTLQILCVFMWLELGGIQIILFHLLVLSYWLEMVLRLAPGMQVV